jgi:hypothetical protein
MEEQFIKILALTGCLNLMACATSQIVNGPDGTPHQLLTCTLIEGCYQNAAEVCGGKYKIVNTSTRVSGDNQFTSSTTIDKRII